MPPPRRLANSRIRSCCAGGEVIRLHVADNQTGESEQLFGLAREAFLELLRIGRIPAGRVLFCVVRSMVASCRLRSSSTARRMNLNSQRGSPSIYRMRGLRPSTFTRRSQRVIRRILFRPPAARSRSESSSAPASPALNCNCSVCGDAVGLSAITSLRGEHFARVAHRRAWPSGRHIRNCGTSRRPPAANRPAWRGWQRDIADLEILIHFLFAEADGVDRNLPLPDLRDRIAIDAAGIVRAVAQQHHRAQRQCGGVGQHLA